MTMCIYCHFLKAVKFMDKFGKEQEIYYREDVDKLACVTKKEHMKGNELMDNFRYIIFWQNLLSFRDFVV